MPVFMDVSPVIPYNTHISRAGFNPFPMVLSDTDIVRRRDGGSLGIDPFCGSKIRRLPGSDAPLGASYGLSSAGYDIRLGASFAVPKISVHAHLSPYAPPELRHMESDDGTISIPPGQYVLAASLERIRVPSDCIAFVQGKSTYARMGIVCNCTPLEPGWEGHVTLQFTNAGRNYVDLMVGEGCAQIVFVKLTSSCGEPYGDGKYQNSGAEPVGARIG